MITILNQVSRKMYANLQFAQIFPNGMVVYLYGTIKYNLHCPMCFRILINIIKDRQQNNNNSTGVHLNRLLQGKCFTSLK